MSDKSEEILDEIENEIDQKDQAENQFKPISIGELLKMDFPEGAWTINNLVPQQGITILAGAPGNYKTWMLLSMAICISKGSKFLDHFECEKVGVLIVDEENHLRIIQDRLFRMGATENLPIHFLSQKDFKVEKKEPTQNIIKFCRENNIGVIFFDSLVRINSANENDASEMSKVMGRLKKFCQAGKTVIVTHHERKEGFFRSSADNRLRGSSDILAAVDSHLALRKDKEDKNRLKVEQPKLRQSEEIEPFDVLIIKEDGTVSFKYGGAHQEKATAKEIAKEAVMKILDENKEGLMKKEIGEKVKIAVGIGYKSTKDALDELVDEGEVIERSAGKNKKLCILSIHDQGYDEKQEPLI